MLFNNYFENYYYPILKSLYPYYTHFKILDYEKNKDEIIIKCLVDINPIIFKFELKKIIIKHTINNAFVSPIYTKKKSNY